MWEILGARGFRFYSVFAAPSGRDSVASYGNRLEVNSREAKNC